MLRKLSWLLLPLAVAACATQGAAITAKNPARSQEAASLRNVRVIGFTGVAGYAEPFATQLEAKLSGINIDGAPYFTVKDRKASRGATGAFRALPNEVQQAVDVAKSEGVDGIYYGEVTAASVEKANYTGTRSVCVEQGFPLCKKYATVPAQCVSYKSAVSVTPKVVNVSTSSVIYSRAISDSRSANYCEGDSSVPTEASLIGTSFDVILNEISKDVAPWTIQTTVAFKNNTDGLPADQAEAFKGAVEFANAGRLDRGCGVLMGMEPSFPENVPLLYNIGVCHESQGQPQVALEYFTKVDSMLTRPDADVSEALERSRAAVEGREYKKEPSLMDAFFKPLGGS